MKRFNYRGERNQRGRTHVNARVPHCVPVTRRPRMEDVARHADRINRYLQELEAVGCVFKGFDAGLVDFYSLREDRPIFLCWKLGEERITHWHEIDAGFSGRQPIDGAILSATSSS